MKYPVSLAVVALLTVGSASAADTPQARLDKRLRGEYALVSHEQCASSASGFGAAPNFQALGPVSTSSAIASGTQVFSGTGTFTTTALSQAPVPPPTDGSPVFPINVSEIVCTGTYVVHADDTVDIESSCSGTQVAGRFAGLLKTTGSPVHYSGRLLGKTLQLSHINAVVTTTDIKIGPSYQTMSYNLCAGNSISTKVPARDQATTEGTEVSE